jgi:hypothetical protein
MIDFLVKLDPGESKSETLTRPELLSLGVVCHPQDPRPTELAGQP